jgi:hypothetical protein
MAERESDSVSEALKGLILRKVASDDEGSLIALIECWRGVSDGGRLERLEADVEALRQQVQRLRGMGEPAAGVQALGRRMG